ncbi:MAG: hypothetical protein NDJ89_08665 [Oligoflexia bacterium]|nr:hypothetical protein [Oligoflexia bacterium]
MRILTKTAVLPALAAALLAGCGQTSITQTLPLETDTYISSADEANHSELEYVLASRSASLEERIILKLPTTDKDTDETLEEILEQGLLFLFYMPFEVMARIISCSDEILRPENLSSATIVLDVDASRTIEPALSGKLQLNLLAKPWWQSASWNRAHPFSKKGLWSTPGGDIDPSVSFAANTTGTSGSATTVNFDITTYFKALISAEGRVPHYGMLVSSANPTMAAVSLRSTQALSTFERPRVLATYTGNCSPSGYGTHLRTYHLGADPAVTNQLIGN